MQLAAGVVGLGVGEQLARAFAADPRCHLAALCDSDPRKLAEVARRFPGVPAVADAAAVLDDPNIDVVAIASYDDFHFDQTMRAITNGKHVFVEKPFVLREAEAEAVRSALSQRADLRLSSNLILRRSPRFTDLKARIARGELGELFYLEGDYNYGRIEKLVSGWRGRIADYSAVHGGGVHIVDLLMWLTDDDIVEVSALGNQIVSRGSSFGNFDMVVTTVRFASGVIGKIGVNFGCVFPHFHNLVAYGTKATFVNGLAGASLFTSRDPARAPQLLETAYPGTHKGELIPSFIDAILGEGDAVVTEHDVFRCMAVCFAIERSAHERRPVAVAA